MNKPVKKNVVEPMLFWEECVKYIEFKYNIRSLRDYYGKFKPSETKEVYNLADRDVEYYDFWHVVIEIFLPDNDSEMYWAEEELLDFITDGLALKIFGMFFDEFGEGEVGNREISFWVSW